MDPISAMATASAAFSALKKGFAIGKDIESMASDLSRWMGALSDLDQMEKEAKNPLFLKSSLLVNRLSRKLSPHSQIDRKPNSKDTSSSSG